MKLETFALERVQSVWENRVAWNLSESGVHPLRVTELLLSPENHTSLLALELGYPQTNGTIELRTLIAAMYGDAGPAHVQVTNGGSEANCIILMRIVSPGDEIVLMTPNYLQAAGIARALGATVRSWPLVRIEGGGGVPAAWRPDLDALPSLVTRQTRAVVICTWPAVAPS